MTQSENTIEAVVEVLAIEEVNKWPVAPLPDFHNRFWALGATLNNDEIGSVVHLACSYNHVKIQSTATETLRSLVEQMNLVLPGGLLFSEHGVAKVVPGCCCGLEDWHEWLTVPNGNGAVWAGHDPTPWVEYTNGQIKVWQDEGKTHPNISFGYDEMAVLLNQAKGDLQEFLWRLRQWTQQIAPEFAEELPAFFSRHLHIPT